MKTPRKYRITSSEPFSIGVLGAILKQDPKARYCKATARYPEHIEFSPLYYHQVMGELTNFAQEFKVYWIIKRPVFENKRDRVNLEPEVINPKSEIIQAASKKNEN